MRGETGVRFLCGYRGLHDASRGRSVQVLLLVLARLGVLVVEDEVDLVGVAALVGAEHDDIRRGIGELLLVESLVLTEELQVSTTALETVCKTDCQQLRA